MLTGLKVSSLACKSVFYKTEQNLMQRGDTMELNFQGLEIQKPNIELELKDR